MKSSSDKIILSITRSRFMKIAPILLWLVAIFIPTLVGRNMYMKTFKQEQEQRVSVERQLLMTRAIELEARLQPAVIFRKQLDIGLYEYAYGKILHENDIGTLASAPLGAALQLFKDYNSNELASFSRFLENHTGIKPVFLAGLHPEPAHCGLYLQEKSIGSPPPENYHQEFAEMCGFLNERSNYIENEPDELRTFARFPFFHEFLGIFDHFNTHFWSLLASFSGRYRERLYLVSMRPPGVKGSGNHVIAGFLASMQEQLPVLKKACAEISDAEISIRPGKTTINTLPFFYEEGGEQVMLMKLPEIFRAAFKRPESTDKSGNMALKLKMETGSNRQSHARHVSLLNLAIMVFVSLSLLIAAGTSLGQLKLRSSLTALITAAFFVSMLLPLSGLAWLGAASSRTSREIKAQRIIEMVRQRLRQSETTIILQRNRQQMLMFYLSRMISTMSPQKWGDYVDSFFFKGKGSPFGYHFYNFYLYSAKLNREYYRGQNPKERFRKNELPNILAGPFRYVLLQMGGFSHLSEAGRQKVSQLADFASGVMEEIVDQQFFNNIFSTPGELNDATLLARRDLLAVFFLWSRQQIVGMLCLVTNHVLPLQILDELSARGIFERRFTLDRHLVEMDFFLISEFFERKLKGRSNSFLNENPPAVSIESADALYGNSDASDINNLHLDPPHLMVTETMMERSIFAVARITPPAGEHSEMPVAIVLTMIGLASCVALALGISRMILLPLPPFLEAIREIENNRYDWSLDLQTGAEFDSLAASINKMKQSLFERRKMLQLVSRTAAEAVKVGENILDKPRRRIATILLSDIRSFTTISENYAAEEVVAMLNDYFTLMCPAIEEQGGHIDKLIGDAIQAVFFTENDSDRTTGAVKAALEMRQRLAVFNADRAARGLFTINNGIGIASGMVTTGVAGSKTGKLEAAVMGEPLQTAARLESFSKFVNNTCIIIDEESLRHIGNRAIVVSLSVDLPDSPTPVIIHELQEI